MMRSFRFVSYIIGNGSEKIKGTHNLFLQPVPEFQEKGESEGNLRGGYPIFFGLRSFFLMIRLFLWPSPFFKLLNNLLSMLYSNP
jgi:hypothetical protein